jgi:hypothetical protein
LAARLSAQEIRTLARFLAVPYDDLPGQGPAAKARELLDTLQRHDRIGELILAGQDLRPDVPWFPRPLTFTDLASEWLSDIRSFSRYVIDKPLRRYQTEPAKAILDSILHGRGLSFTVMMSRQAGKNELSGQLEAYLLNLYRRPGGQIVKASPTFKPQTINSILRLTDHLCNPWNDGTWRRREGYIVQLEHARCLFFSGEPNAHVVGGTADLLLECDEAQDVTSAKWDKDFAPMAASTNATTVFWGTAWTSDTMLARQTEYLRTLERKDGRRRVFAYSADQVGAEVPAYAQYVERQVQKLGRQHPLIKTQYYLETIDGRGGLFGPLRRALIRGDHPRQHEPQPGRRYALLIDVAGEDEQAGDAIERAMLANPKRDATALTVVEVDVQPGQLPIYRAIDRKLWLGVKHTALHAQVLALAQHWHAAWVVVDATGVGAGLASFLVAALGERVLPIQFSPKVKSDLGWNYLAVVETGRYRDYSEPDPQPETRQFWHELEACQYTIRDGPGQQMSWGVWESPAYDGLIAYGHDDLLLSAALTAILDQQPWPGTGPSALVERHDELADIDQRRWG